MMTAKQDRLGVALVLWIALVVGGCAETDEPAGEASNSSKTASRALEGTKGGAFDFDAMLEEATTAAARSDISDCAGGSMEACYAAGNHYHGGDGVPRNNDLSVELIEYACEGGFIRACYDLGARYYLGIEVEQNLAKARSQFEHGCEASYPEACHMLGRMAKEGLGGPSDLGRARRLFQRSCSLGFERDCRRELTMLRRDGGVWESELPADAPKELVEAARRCDAGLMSGCTQLARAYERGRDLPEEFETAEELYRLACDWGKLEACSVYRMMEGTAHRFD